MIFQLRQVPIKLIVIILFAGVGGAWAVLKGLFARPAQGEEQLGAEQRDALYRKLLDEKGSLFASHPTFGERIEAIMSLPAAHQEDTTAALALFDKPEELEKELTEFLTGYVYHLRQAQAGAAAQG